MRENRMQNLISKKCCYNQFFLFIKLTMSLTMQRQRSIRQTTLTVLLLFSFLSATSTARIRRANHRTTNLEENRVKAEQTTHLSTANERLILQPDEINILWQRLTPSSGYFEQYKDIMAHASKFANTRYSNFPPKGIDFPRVHAVLDFDNWLSKYKIREANHVLAFFDDIELDFLRYKSIDMLPYSSDTGENDLHKPLKITRLADFVVTGQTLEHLYDPLLCLRNIYDAMKPGGYFFTSVPYVNKLHMTPFHFFHFTPTGLAVALHRAGFDVLEIGQFGNVNYTDLVMRGDVTWWPDAYQLMDAKKQIVNDPNVPVQVWALCKKPFDD